MTFSVNPSKCDKGLPHVSKQATYVQYECEIQSQWMCDKQV